jgi:hypothetical protein
MATREIKGQTKLLDREGNLTTYGWARQPYLDPNLENLNFYALKSFQKFRLKRWQYYGITTPTHFFSFTISSVGYLGPVFAYVLNFENGEYREATLNIPFAQGISLPPDSKGGDCHYMKGGIHLHVFIRNDNSRLLDIAWPGFSGMNLKGRVQMTLPQGHESMINVFPSPNKRFFYTRKINCMPAEGVIECGQEENKNAGEKTAKEYIIKPDTCLGCLDWGLGVWPYRSFWIWGSFSHFLPDGRTIGLNLGGGIGNDPDVNDNAIIVNGKIHKLGIVDFKYDNKDFNKTWQMISRDGRLSLEFKPFFMRTANTDLLVLSSKLNQMFGKYSGIVVTDEGEKIEVNDLIGWVEEHHARW